MNNGNKQQSTPANNQYEQDSSVNSTTESTSTLSIDSFSSTYVDGHLYHCLHQRSGTCICLQLKKHYKFMEKRKLQKLDAERKMQLQNFDRHKITSSNKLSTKTSMVSPDSSNPSFHTAEAGTSKQSSIISSDSYESTFCPEPSMASDKTYQINEKSNDEYSSNTYVNTCETRSFTVSDVEMKKKSDLDCQSLLRHIEGNLNFGTETNSVVANKIKPFFKRLSIVAAEKSDDSDFKECVNNLYQTFQEDSDNFAAKLTTILEESTLPPDDPTKTIKYFNELFIEFKHLNIQDESMPSAFADQTTSPHPNTDALCQHVEKLNIDIDLDKIDNSTPIRSKKPSEKFLQKNSNLKKNSNKAKASPLLVTAVTRNMQIGCQTPTSATSSPVTSPGTPRSHNDSTFTALEKKLVGNISPTVNKEWSPRTKENKSEIERRAQEQLQSLQSSPCISSLRDTDKLKQDHNFSLLNSPCLSSTPKKLNLNNHTDTAVNESTHTYHSSVLNVEFLDSSNVNDADESILHEYVTQRQRFLETEKTIRAIQGLSGNPNIDNHLLNVLSEYTDHGQVAKSKNVDLSSKKKKVTQKNPSTLKNKNQLVKTDVKNSPQTPWDGNVTLRSNSNLKKSRPKSPTFRTPLSFRTKLTRTPLSRTPVRYNNYLKSGFPRSPSPSKSHSQSPSDYKVQCRKKLLTSTPKKPVTKKVDSKVSTVFPTITVSTPLNSTKHKKILYSGIKNSNKTSTELNPTPLKSLVTRGQYFNINTPDKALADKKKIEKNIKYFETPEVLRKKGTSSYLNNMNVRSPVRDYIYGSSSSSETLNFLLKSKEKENIPILKSPPGNNSPPSGPQMFASTPKKKLVQSNQCLENDNKRVDDKKCQKIVIITEDIPANFSLHITTVNNERAYYLRPKK